jgi:hypothetical protein
MGPKGVPEKESDNARQWAQRRGLTLKKREAGGFYT